ncbi:hypothetical protein [Sphingomonas baiyangensis]|uniref:Lipoprotein n=1 Tax=Sphingomonas baiyangensis TaxID=2572576 RepID=A0A4U1L3V7_9SPHN|nr:hypothetical protein [Sphingomonas baiyangensis]TKD51174.1 hypothetical protein FBR43_10705 [Sphingomonas baiyangensis]
MRAALLLGVALALAGCERTPPEPTVLENEAAQAATAATMRGWDRAFNMPAEAVAFANQFGFRAPTYAADGDGSFLSQGNPITLSQSDAENPNTGAFEVAGSRADVAERFVFTLAITDPANAATAKQRFADVITGFLSQYEIEDDGALGAVTNEQDADGMLAGTPMSVAVAPGDDDSRTITVTFSRPATTTPDIQPAQGQ